MRCVQSSAEGLLPLFSLVATHNMLCWNHLNHRKLLKDPPPPVLIGIYEVNTFLIKGNYQILEGF